MTAVKKIQTLHDSTTKHNNLQNIFLDTDNNQQIEQGQSDNIQQEQEKLERANLISIIPAPQTIIQHEPKEIQPIKKPEIKEPDNTYNTIIKTNSQESQEPAGNKQEELNTLDMNTEDTNNKEDQSVDKQDKNTKDTTNKKDQLVDKPQHKIQKSTTSSTTSQEYCTPPLSPDSDISDINSAHLEALNETL